MPKPTQKLFIAPSVKGREDCSSCASPLVVHKIHEIGAHHLCRWLERDQLRAQIFSEDIEISEIPQYCAEPVKFAAQASYPLGIEHVPDGPQDGSEPPYRGTHLMQFFGI